jgi:hypothetical protein
MIKLVSRLLFTFNTANPLQKLLDPIALNFQQASTLPVLKLKSEKYLMQNWWS